MQKKYILLLLALVYIPLSASRNTIKPAYIDVIINSIEVPITMTSTNLPHHKTVIQPGQGFYTGDLFDRFTYPEQPYLTIPLNADNTHNYITITAPSSVNSIYRVLGYHLYHDQEDNQIHVVTIRAHKKEQAPEPEERVYPTTNAHTYTIQIIPDQEDDFTLALIPVADTEVF